MLSLLFYNIRIFFSRYKNVGIDSKSSFSTYYYIQIGTQQHKYYVIVTADH